MVKGLAQIFEFLNIFQICNPKEPSHLLLYWPSPPLGDDPGNTTRYRAVKIIKLKGLADELIKEQYNIVKNLSFCATYLRADLPEP